jgi:hypothetical protein
MRIRTSRAIESSGDSVRSSILLGILNIREESCPRSDNAAIGRRRIVSEVEVWSVAFPPFVRFVPSFSSEFRFQQEHLSHDRRKACSRAIALNVEIS